MKKNLCLLFILFSCSHTAKEFSPDQALRVMLGSLIKEFKVGGEQVRSDLKAFRSNAKKNQNKESEEIYRKLFLGFHPDGLTQFILQYYHQKFTESEVRFIYSSLQDPQIEELSKQVKNDFNPRYYYSFWQHDQLNFSEGRQEMFERIASDLGIWTIQSSIMDGIDKLFRPFVNKGGKDLIGYTFMKHRKEKKMNLVYSGYFRFELLRYRYREFTNEDLVYWLEILERPLVARFYQEQVNAIQFAFTQMSNILKI